MDANNDIIARITELIDDSMVAPSAFAAQVGIDPANFRRKLKGEQPITIKDIEKICKAKNVLPEWLQNGTGEKRHIPANDEIQCKIKNDIIELARKLSQNEAIILQAKRENEDIMRQLNTLYIQLDKY